MERRANHRRLAAIATFTVLPSSTHIISTLPGFSLLYPLSLYQRLLSPRRPLCQTRKSDGASLTQLLPALSWSFVPGISGWLAFRRSTDTRGWWTKRWRAWEMSRGDAEETRGSLPLCMNDDLITWLRATRKTGKSASATPGPITRVHRRCTRVHVPERRLCPAASCVVRPRCTCATRLQPCTIATYAAFIHRPAFLLSRTLLVRHTREP